MYNKNFLNTPNHTQSSKKGSLRHRHNLKIKSAILGFIAVLPMTLFSNSLAQASSNINISCEEATRIVNGYKDGSITNPNSSKYYPAGISTTCLAVAQLLYLEACRSVLIVKGVTGQSIDQQYQSVVNLLGTVSANPDNIQCPELPPVRAEIFS